MFSFLPCDLLHLEFYITWKHLFLNIAKCIPIEMKVPWKNSVEHFLPHEISSATLWRGKKVWLLVHFSDEINSNMNALYQGLFWLSVFQDPFNLCQLLYRIGNVTPQIFSTVFWLSYYMLFPFHFSIRSLTWPLQGYSSSYKFISNFVYVE